MIQEKRKHNNKTLSCLVVVVAAAHFSCFLYFSDFILHRQISQSTQQPRTVLTRYNTQHNIANPSITYISAKVKCPKNHRLQTNKQTTTMINFLTTAAVLLATASASTSASDVSANNDDNQRVHRPNVRAVRGVRGSSNTGGGGGGGVTTDETAFKSAIMDKAFDFLQQQKGHQHQPQQRTLQTDGGKGKKKGSSSSGKGKKKGGDDGGGDETCTIDVSFSSWSCSRPRPPFLFFSHRTVSEKPCVC